MSDPRARQCPRCGGTGSVYRHILCTCGHRRSDHISGVGCTGYSGHCEDDCERFRRDPDQDAPDVLALLRDEEHRAQGRHIERSVYGDDRGY